MGRVIIDEIEFNIPYGKLSAKTWHEETDDCKRILLLHGWMDNSGSFDYLAPLIKNDTGLYIVALDFPGHGRSSQLPAGTTYCDTSIIMEIRRCLVEMGWVKIKKDSNSKDDSNERKFTIIGHSLGAGLGLFYASLFPDDVDEIILLDFIKSKTLSPQQALSSLAHSIDQFIGTVSSQQTHSSSNLKHLGKNADKGQVIVSQEAAIIATIEAHKQLGSLTREEATCLLKRSTVAVSTPPNSVIYSRDLRLQCMLNMREDYDLNRIMFSGIKCHIVAFLATRGIYEKDPLFLDHFQDVQDLLRSKAKSFHVQWIDGDHFVHMNNAQLVADLISSYLKSPADFKVSK